MTRAFVATVARIASATIVVAPWLLATARAGTVSSGITLTGNAEYSTNPFLLQQTDGGVVRGQITLSPYVEDKTARSSLRVSANASYSKFSRRYRDTIDLGTQVGYTNSLTRKLSLRAGLALSSTIGGSFATDPIFDGPSPDEFVPRPIDITLVGLQERTTRAQGSTGLSYQADDKNSFNLGYDASVLRFPSSLRRSEYSSLGQTAGYSRVINSRFSAGVSVGVARVNYFGTTLGDAVIISPSVNGSLRVSRLWTINGGVGFSSSRVNILGGRLNSTDLSASLNACRTDARTSWCLNGSRATGASSFEGVRATTSIGTSYSYKITSRDTITASGGYSRSAAPAFSLRGPTSYLSGRASYSRRFSPMVSGQINGGFTRSSFEGTRSNAFVSAGISFNMGAR